MSKRISVKEWGMQAIDFLATIEDDMGAAIMHIQSREPENVNALGAARTAHHNLGVHVASLARRIGRYNEERHIATGYTAVYRCPVPSPEVKIDDPALRPIVVWTGRDGDVADCPDGGAFLDVKWAHSEQSYCAWYPTVDAAKAELAGLAVDFHAAIDSTGLNADMTAHGASESSTMHVTRR
jgi:hypothetical protein